MQFNTGIAISKEAENDVYVAAATWFSISKPPFSVRGFTFPHAKEKLLSVLVVRNVGHVQAINAACHRTIESLIVKNYIAPGTAPGIKLLIKPYLAKEHFLLQCKRATNHWLLNAADAVLNGWLRGER